MACGGGSLSYLLSRRCELSLQRFVLPVQLLVFLLQCLEPECQLTHQPVYLCTVHLRAGVGATTMS